jgi:hypothetical protein
MTRIEDRLKVFLFPIVFSLASAMILKKLNDTDTKLELLLDRTARLEERILGEQRINLEFRQQTEKFLDKLPFKPISLIFDKHSRLTYDPKRKKYDYV